MSTDSSDNWQGSEEQEGLRNAFETQGSCSMHGTPEADEKTLEEGEKMVLTYLNAVDTLNQEGLNTENSIYDGEGNFYVSAKELSQNLENIQEKAVEDGILDKEILKFNYSQGDLRSRELSDTLKSLYKDEIVDRESETQLKKENASPTDQYWALNKEPSEIEIGEDLEKIAIYDKKLQHKDDLYIEEEGGKEVTLDEQLYEIALDTLQEYEL